jgi:hypothetical protein
MRRQIRTRKCTQVVKPDKPRRFANVAIQKPQYRKAYPVPFTSRNVSIGESESESEEVAQYAGIDQNMDLVNVRIMTARNKESVLGRAFSRFQWLESGEDAIGSKIGTTRFNSQSIRIDHDIPYHNAGQIPNTNEPLGCYPLSEQILVSEHDDKVMNDMEHNDDAYMREVNTTRRIFLFRDQWLLLKELWSLLKGKWRGCAQCPPAARLQLLPQLALPRISRLRDRNSKQSSRRARRRLSTTCCTRWLARPEGLTVFMLRRGQHRTKTRS